jgi:hypothetical protein
MHISEGFVIFEYPSVNQTFHNNLFDGGRSPGRKEVMEKHLPVVKSGTPEPFEVYQRQIDQYKSHTCHKRPDKKGMVRNVHGP